MAGSAHPHQGRDREGRGIGDVIRRDVKFGDVITGDVKFGDVITGT